MQVLVIGAGNGGAAAGVELSLAGHNVTVFARSEETLAPFQSNGLSYEGVLGEGTIRSASFSTNLAHAAKGAQVAVVTLPTTALADVARALCEAGWGSTRPVILNPGHTGGAFEFKNAWKGGGLPLPPLVEFATLAYVARKPRPDCVNISGRAKNLRAASLNDEGLAMEVAQALFPGVYDCGDVIACDLSNVNMIVHPPGAMLGASWVEATGGDFTFYVQGLTDGVVRVMEALDEERREVGRAYGHDLPTIIAEMRSIGTVPSGSDDHDYRAIAAGQANRLIRAPNSLTHRYFTEDFTHGLVPFLALAKIAGVTTPVASALIALHGSLVRGLNGPSPRDARAMGLEGLTLSDLRTP